MKITSLAYSRPEDDPKHRKNPDAVRPAPSPLGLAALGVGGGGSSGSGGTAADITVGITTITSGTTTRLLYNNAGVLGTSVWSGATHLLASVDNTYDIGASGATRPRNVFIAGNITGNRADFNGFYAVNNYFLTNSGNLTLWNLAATDFSRLQFGGTTSSFPALKRSSAELQVVLADDTGFAATQSLYIRYGSGTPEGAVTAPVGAIYSRTDGGAGTSFYVKESGTGNTGWVAK